MSRVLFWGKITKARATTDHNERFQSDSGVAGTYVPNMSQEDELKWKAKYISGDDARVEIRKGLGAALMLLVVRRREDRFVMMSANGKMAFSMQDWSDLSTAVHEAMTKLMRPGDE